MKLGTQTGSLVNHVLTTSKATIPAVGDGATIYSWSDRDAATVVEVFEKNGKQFVVVTEDDAVMTAGSAMSEHQEYEYTSRPDGHRMTYRLDDGKWQYVVKGESGRYKKVAYRGVTFGRRNSYRDPSF